MPMNITRLRHLAALGDAAAAAEVLRWRARRGEGECVPPYPSTKPRLEIGKDGWPTQASKGALADWAATYIRGSLAAAGMDLGDSTLRIAPAGWVTVSNAHCTALAYLYPSDAHQLGVLLGQAMLTKDGPSWVPHPGAAPHIPRTHGLYAQPIPLPQLPLALAPCDLWRFQETPDQREAVEAGRCRG
jgi:hypothetical protein